MSNKTLNVFVFRDASSPLHFGYGDPEYARLIVLLIQEERENNAHVGPLHPERARGADFEMNGSNSGDHPVAKSDHKGSGSNKIQMILPSSLVVPPSGSDQVCP